MPYLIPNDWDGEKWSCYQLQWPASPAWDGILRGLLYLMSRGRSWDRLTGSIKDTQQIGLEIWDRNWPFHYCNGEQAPENGDNGQTQGSTPIGALGAFFEALESEFTMAGSILDIRCVGNELQVQRFPCCEWETICTIPGGSPDEPQPFPDADPDVELCACGMATALVDALFTVADAVWDAQGSNPFQWVGLVNAALPGYSLGTTQIWAAVQQAIDLDNDYSKAEVLTDFRKAQLTCLLAGLMSDGQEYINSSQYLQYKALTSVVFEGEQRQWMSTCIDIIGEGDNRAISALGATDCTSTCDCPEDPLSPPTGTDWCYDFDFTAGMQGFVSDEGDYLAGTGFRGTTNYFGTGSRVQLSLDVTGSLSYTVKYVGVEYDAPAGSGDGEDDYVALGGSRISEDNISLGEGSNLIYQRQSDTAIASGTTDCSIDFSRVDTSNQRIVVSRLIICGNGDDPFA